MKSPWRLAMFASTRRERAYTPVSRARCRSIANACSQSDRALIQIAFGIGDFTQSPQRVCVSEAPLLCNGESILCQSKCPRQVYLI